jgi:hypothetical protein
LFLFLIIYNQKNKIFNRLLGKVNSRGDLARCPFGDGGGVGTGDERVL